jgi:putative RNA 2'-phosphotransferase
MPSQVKISKFLSLVLRHRPDAIGLDLDDGGWSDIVELIEKARKTGVNLTPAVIRQVVSASDKQRFRISSDCTRIRANRGHSIPVELSLQVEEPSEILYHGTARRNLVAIHREGIKRSNRNYVHLSMDTETALKVGARHGQPVVLFVQAARMSSDGIRFFRSENDVWLTEYVAPEYLRLMPG